MPVCLQCGFDNEYDDDIKCAQCKAPLDLKVTVSRVPITLADEDAEEETAGETASFAPFLVSDPRRRMTFVVSFVGTDILRLSGRDPLFESVILGTLEQLSDGRPARDAVVASTGVQIDFRVPGFPWKMWHDEGRGFTGRILLTLARNAWRNGIVIQQGLDMSMQALDNGAVLFRRSRDSLLPAPQMFAACIDAKSILQLIMATDEVHDAVRTCLREKYGAGLVHDNTVNGTHQFKLAGLPWHDTAETGAAAWIFAELTDTLLRIGWACVSTFSISRQIEIMDCKLLARRLKHEHREAVFKHIITSKDDGTCMIFAKVNASNFAPF